VRSVEDPDPLAADQLVEGVDVIDCGPGTDRVTYFGPVDPLDELVGCERVRVLD